MSTEAGLARPPATFLLAAGIVLAAPESFGWSRRIVYDVVADGAVLASATFDQSGGGDQWHTIASVPIAASGAPEVRIHSEGNAPAMPTRCTRVPPPDTTTAPVQST